MRTDRLTLEGVKISLFRPVLWPLLLLLGALAGCQNAPGAALDASRAALERQDYAQALGGADAYLKDKPSGNRAAEAHYLRGRALEDRIKSSESQRTTDLHAARSAYESALTLAPLPPLDGYILTSLGGVCFWQGDYAPAEVHLTAAFDRLDRDDLKAPVWFRVGLCQQRQGKWEVADTTFQLLRQRFPETQSARDATTRLGARGYFVQVASYQNPASAQQTAAGLRKTGYGATVVPKPDRGFHAVMAGPFRNFADATAAKGKLTLAYHDAVIVP